MGMGNHSNVRSVRAVVLFKLQRFANAKFYKFSWGLNGYPRSTFSVFSAIWMRPRKTNPSRNTRENRLSGTTIRLLGVFVPLSSSNCKDSQMQSSITFKFSWGLNGYQRSTFSVFSARRIWPRTTNPSPNSRENKLCGTWKSSVVDATRDESIANCIQ